MVAGATGGVVGGLGFAISSADTKIHYYNVSLIERLECAKNSLNTIMGAKINNDRLIGIMHSEIASTEGISLAEYESKVSKAKEVYNEAKESYSKLLK